MACLDCLAAWLILAKVDFDKVREADIVTLRTLFEVDSRMSFARRNYINRQYLKAWSSHCDIKPPLPRPNLTGYSNMSSEQY